MTTPERQISPDLVDCEQATWQDVYDCLMICTNLTHDEINLYIDHEASDALEQCEASSCGWFSDLDTQHLWGQI